MGALNAGIGAKVGQSLRMAEIGVLKAGTSRELLNRHPRLHWIGVDAYDDEWPLDGNQSENLAEAVANLAPFVAEGRASLWRVASASVTDAEVPRGSLDLVFVDA